MFLLVVLGATIALAAWSVGSGGRNGFRHFADGDLSFDYPASWREWPAQMQGTMGSSIAILGTLPPDSSCGATDIDINCYYQQALAPGQISVRVGTGASPFRTLLVDPEPAPGMTWQRLEVSGLPAIRTIRHIVGSYYQEDEQLTLDVAFPTALDNWFDIEAIYRGPGGEGARAAIDALFDSVRIGPDPLPTRDPSAGPTVLATFIGSLARAGQGHTGGETFYDCFPTSPGTHAAHLGVDPNGAELSQPLDVACASQIKPQGSRFWIVELRVSWPATPGRSAGEYVETMWLSLDGQAAYWTRTGEPPR